MQTIEDIHGDVTVASVTVSLSRNMNMAISGTITDEAYIIGMLESAADYLKKQQARRKVAEGGQVIIAGHDTALYRTPEEQRLIAARDALDKLI